METAKDRHVEELYTAIEAAHDEGLLSKVNAVWEDMRAYVEQPVPQTEETVTLRADHILLDIFLERTTDPEELDALFQNVADCEAGILPYYDQPDQIWTSLNETVNQAREALIGELAAQQEIGSHSPDPSQPAGMQD